MAQSSNVKQALLRAMGGYVLDNGLNTASLRPLAKAAATSDRMLIYHFGSKDLLMAALLQHLAGDLAVRLEEALPARPSHSSRACILEIVSLLRTPSFRRYMALWFEILSAAGKGNSNVAGVGGAMLSGFLDWLVRRLPENTVDPDGEAAMMLTVIEGVVVMDTIGHSPIADQAMNRLFPA